MSSSNCCFLTCIQIYQKAGQVVCYPHLFKNFPQFLVIHTVKGFDVVNKAEVVVFLELFCFFDDPADVGNLISGSSAFSKSNLNIWKFTVHILLKPGLENLKLNIQKTKIMSSITSWQIDGKTMGTVRDFIFWVSKITADGDSSHEIKREHSLEGKLWPT